MEHGTIGFYVRKTIAIIAMAIGGMAIAVLVAFVFGFAVQWLWNWLLPDLFGWKTISFWQAIAVIVLARLIVGGIGGHGRHGLHRHHGRFAQHGPCSGRGPWHGHGCAGHGGPHGHRHGPMHGWRSWREEADLWNLEGGAEDWQYYRDYWKDRGKSDFEEYVRKQKSNDSQDSNQ